MTSLHTLEIKRTARYATLGTLSEQTEQVWFVCHGYGQLATYFIRKFDVLDPVRHFVVAPEALSRFYLDNFSGRVGATWMTKEAREEEISDYLAYLNQLYAHILANSPRQAKELHINLLGFSQGVATASRWLFDGKIKIDSFIMWAGGIAHDLDFSRATDVLGNKSLYFIYGKQDELIKEADFQKQIQKLGDLGVSPELITFEGKHELSREVLKTYFGK